MIVNDYKRTMMLTIVVVALVISSPFMVKWMLNQDSQISPETYYHLRIIEQIKQNPHLGMQADVLQNTHFNFNLFYFVFSKADIDMHAAAKYFPVIMGILSIILFYILLRSFNLGQDDIFFSLIILMTTPVFLYAFTTFSGSILALPVCLIGLILFFRGNALSSIFFGATAFIDIFYTLLCLIIVAGNYIHTKSKSAFHIANIGAIVIAVAFGTVALGINYMLEFIPVASGLNGFVIEFGAIKGYAFMTLGLALIGLFSYWNKESTKTYILVSVLLLIVASIFFQNLRLPVALIAAVFAGFSISYLSNREWEIYMLKGVTLLLVFCILFFSAILSLNYQIKDITDEEVTAYSYLGTANEGDIILSAERNGFLVEYASGRTAYFDGNSYKYEDYEVKKRTASQIYYAKNMKELEAILSSENITHILLDAEMKSGEVWNGRNEGLLFFLENSNRFIKIFYNDDIQIYRYVPK